MTELERTLFYNLDDLVEAADAFESASDRYIVHLRTLFMEINDSREVLAKNRAAYDKDVEDEAKRGEP